VILSGFGFHRIRDYEPLGVPSHAIHLGRVLSWLGHVVQDPVAVGRSVSHEIVLSQNFPNPFNPSTSIRFSVPRNTNVRIAVYDVAGRLIRVLEDEARAAGVVYEAKWDGRGSDGVGLASGVYFCKLEALGQVHTRKLVLLK
jgi:flagellar hook capping protein FlgD